MKLFIKNVDEISHLLQPDVEQPWDVGQREEPVQHQGHVLRVDPEVVETWKKGFLCLYL